VLKDKKGMRDSLEKLENEMTLMLIWCSWCKLPVDVKNGPLNKITHSICYDCASKEEKKILNK